MVRDINQKIFDIKALRAITRLLGKLHISPCYTKHTDTEYIYDKAGNLIHTFPIVKEFYGIGLAEAKAYVEKKYIYNIPNPTPLQQVTMGNEIHEIKRTRQLMHMLEKLGLKSPDAGLQVCRQFVTRQRNKH